MYKPCFFQCLILALAGFAFWSFGHPVFPIFVEFMHMWSWGGMCSSVLLVVITNVYMTAFIFIIVLLHLVTVSRFGFLMYMKM